MPSPYGLNGDLQAQEMLKMQEALAKSQELEEKLATWQQL